MCLFMWYNFKAASGPPLCRNAQAGRLGRRAAPAGAIVPLFREDVFHGNAKDFGQPPPKPVKRLLAMNHLRNVVGPRVQQLCQGIGRQALFDQEYPDLLCTRHNQPCFVRQNSFFHSEKQLTASL